jgi:hypothetical protein
MPSLDGVAAKRPRPGSVTWGLAVAEMLGPHMRKAQTEREREIYLRAILRARTAADAFDLIDQVRADEAYYAMSAAQADERETSRACVFRGTRPMIRARAPRRRSVRTGTRKTRAGPSSSDDPSPLPDLAVPAGVAR